MGNINQLVKKIYQNDGAMSAESAVCSLGSYFHQKEARRLLAINVFNCFDVGKEAVFLIPDSEKRVKSYKLLTKTEISTYKCAICTTKDCKNCHYSMKTNSDRYMVLDDLLILSVAYKSAMDQNFIECAIELADQITDLLKLDLPKLDSSKSRFSASKFITMSMSLRAILGGKGL
jgi:hypothetical protein